MDVRGFSIRLTIAVIFFLWALHPAVAQDGQAPMSPEERETVAKALEMVGSGDLEGAVLALEPLHERGGAPPIARATLGALYLELGLEDDALAILRPLADAPEANPAVLYNAGRAALAQGEGPLGESYLERCVALQPVSPAARTLGLLRGGQGRSAEAFGLLEPWAATNPGDQEARLAAAVSGLQLGRLPEAEALLEGLPSSEPKVALLRADLLLKRRDAEGAVALLEPLLGQAPAEARVDLLVLLSTAYLELGRSAAAVDLLRERGSAHPRLALALARAQHRGGNVEEATATLAPFAARLPAPGNLPKTLPSNAPLMASMALEYGRLLLTGEQAEQAGVFLSLASELNPYSRETWQELARARAATGDQAGAEEALGRLEALAEARERAKVPGFTGQRRQEDSTGKRLAEALEWVERGEAQKALDILRQEISLAPEDPRPRLLEVRTLVGLGQLDAALASIDTAVPLFPESPDVLHFRAVVRLARGELDPAEADLARALALRADHLPAINDMALVHQRRGEVEKAREWLEKALAIRPDDPLAQQRLQSLERVVPSPEGS